MRRKAKPAPNLTARYAERIVRAARRGDFIGFAAVCLTKTGAVETWFVPPDAARRLAGEVHMLNQRVAWEAGGPQNINDRPLLSGHAAYSEKPKPKPNRKKK